MEQRELVMAFKNGMRPVHSGEVLREDFMRPADLSANALVDPGPSTLHQFPKGAFKTWVHSQAGPGQR
jgi:hypothetical protein